MIKKEYLKLWGIRGFYQYEIYKITDAGAVWIEAVPKTPGLATRIAENETDLKPILERDVATFINFQQRVR